MNTAMVRRLRLVVGALVVLGLLAACAPAEPGAALERMQSESRRLSSALSEAVGATQDASLGYADASFANRAIGSAESATERLSTSASRVGDPEARSLASEAAGVARRIVASLKSGDVATAADLRSETFVPLASEIAALEPGAGGAVVAQQGDTPSFVLPAVVGLVVVVTAVGVAMRRPRSKPDQSTTPAPRPGARAAEERRQPTRTWSDPHPLFSAAPEQSPPSEGVEPWRTAKVRAIDIELKSLLVSAMEQGEDRGWDVTLVCPDVHISGDPIRLQRAVVAAVGGAYLRGAERVGIMVDDLGDRVVVSIGDDAPIADDAVDGIAERMVDQVRHALGRSDIDVAWLRDDGVTLVSMTLNRAPAVGVATGADTGT